uniref:Amino acid transporter transmembrane domain-containing protein n=2 Tax=Hemiselmis andersenii TaxID=464988 RepID=A0A7S0XV53_HEMAN|mmetsp:Transcript_23161/g.53303  ORF Transcript_23161/g.53303 Transcript_23161/m.53303 type:complete len:572 (+) Transcript_23161:43-1758(+)
MGFFGGREAGEEAMAAEKEDMLETAAGDEAPVRDSTPVGREGFGSHVAFALTINMVMGAGVVGLPYAFFHAGAWVSCLILALATVIAVITMGYIVEVCGWCEGWTAESELDEEDRCLTLDDDQGDESAGGEICGARREGRRAGRPVGPHLFRIQNRTFELTEMCGLFLGVPVSPTSFLHRFCDSRDNLPVARVTMEILLCCNIMISCWLYVSIFGSSLSIIVPQPFVKDPPDISKCLAVCSALEEAPCLSSSCEWVNGTCAKSGHLEAYCDSSYSFFSWVFGVVMMAIACLDLSGLSAIQGCLSLFAFCSLLVMVATTVIATATDTGDDKGWDRIPDTNLGGLGQLITCAVTSQMSHQGVPTLVVLMRKKHKAKKVFCGALAYSLSMYVLLCMSTSVFFGPSISSIVTLNWERYSGGAAAGEVVPWWASALSFMVLLFPVVSVSAAFPLQLVVISEILQKAFGGSDSSTPRGAWSSAPLRIICCFGAVCLAQALNNVSQIISANAAVAIIVAFMLPCLLHLSARSKSIKKWGPDAARTPYHTPVLSHPIFVSFIFAVSCAIEGFALYQISH